MRQIRVLLADDHSLLRMGLAALISGERDLEIVGEAEDGDIAVSLVETARPDVVVMDLVMPTLSGAEAARRIKGQNPAIRVLILTSYGTASELVDALAAGVDGVLLKNAPADDVLDAIRAVLRGKRVIPPDIDAFIREESSAPRISARQMEILQSAARGFTTREIAGQLGISVSRVLKHFHAIFEKMGVSNRAEAIASAMRRQLLRN